MTNNGFFGGTPQIPANDPITPVLAANNLPVREKRYRARGIMTAVQPLSIDGQEIFSDTVLAEFITYRTADQMVRETETLTLKKTAFGAFESSLTPIPKYCFKNTSELTAVLVHSVPKFTLEDILTIIEKEYSRPYPVEPLSFYADWIVAVIDRIQSRTKPGRGRLLSMALRLPKHIFPKPPRVAQTERKAFAALIVHTVERHHRANIYNNCISENTVFFPTPNQPMLLSNYSGVPSAMLSDILPPELMADEAVANYGPQCRDIYCLALICYRILTGERYDSRRFTLESPRPLAVVISEMVRRAQQAFSFKNPAAARQSVASLFKAVGGIIALLRPLFSTDTFAAWRKINRASGGLWRSIPLVGPFCDIVAPTVCAKALRYVLDKPWFISYFFRKGPPADRSNLRGPGISVLTAALKVRPPFLCPHFESAHNELSSESALKRQTFGSIMEAGISIKNEYSMRFDRRILLAVSAIVLAMAGLFSFFIRQRFVTAEKVVTGPPTTAVTSIIDRKPLGSTPPEAAKPSTATSPMASKAYGSGKGIDGKEPPHLLKRSKIPVVPGGSLRSSEAARPKKTSPPARARRESVAATDEKIDAPTALVGHDSTPAAAPKTSAAPKRVLYPATGFQGVFIVAGVGDSCNPGKLYYFYDGRPAAIMISRLPEAALKLFVAHRTPTGFGSIETIRLCRMGGCDRTMYYKAVGMNGIGKPVYVKTGDALSQDRNKLRIYIESKKASR